MRHTIETDYSPLSLMAVTSTVADTFFCPIDVENRIVRELKPDNPRTIQDGKRQLERYRKELEDETKKSWTSFLDIYVP